MKSKRAWRFCSSCSKDNKRHLTVGDDGPPTSGPNPPHLRVQSQVKSITLAGSNEPQGSYCSHFVLADRKRMVEPNMAEFPTIEQYVGGTPLVRLQRLQPTNGSTVLLKLEGNNPAGSVKDRPALNMIVQAERRGSIRPGDTIIEATSGNTGIALAMAAAIKGYRMILIMPDNATAERKASMQAYGAELILVSKAQGMEGARDLALQMQAAGQGKVLDQFNNLDNPSAHIQSTGPEIWQQSQGLITHFVSSMGTTGTIMGVSQYLKQQNPAIQIVGLQPAEGSSIPGIRRWPEAYLPGFYQKERVDLVLDVQETDALDTMRQLARQEGICAGVSSGGAVWAALQIAQQHPGAVVVAIVCDRGDRYLSSGVFNVAPA